MQVEYNKPEGQAKKVRTKIITIASGKGGAGKSILSLALSRIITSQRDRNTCVLLDLDFHVKGLTLLYYPSLSILTDEPFSMYDLMFKETSLGSLLGDWKSPEPCEALIVPAYQHIRTPLDYDLVSSVTFGSVMERLKDVLDFVRASDKPPDFIIIDTRAGIDNYCLAAAVLSDLTIIVTEQDRVSFRASYDLQTQIMMKGKQELDVDNQGIKATLPFFLYNKVVDSRLTVDDVTNLPPIAFDRELFNEYQKNTQGLIFTLKFKRSNFMRDTKRSWATACSHLGITEPKADVWTSLRLLFQKVLDLFWNVGMNLKYNPFLLSIALVLGVLLTTFLITYDRQLKPFEFMVEPEQTNGVLASGYSEVTLWAESIDSIDQAGDGWKRLPVDAFEPLQLTWYQARSTPLDGNGCVQAEFKGIYYPGAETRPRYGLGLKDIDKETGYEFYISEGNVFTVYERFSLGGKNPVTKLNRRWERSDAVSEFVGGVNRLRICRSGQLLTFFIGDHRLFSHSQAHTIQPTWFGIMVSTGAEVQFRNLEVCWQDCE